MAHIKRIDEMTGHEADAMGIAIMRLDESCTEMSEQILDYIRIVAGGTGDNIELGDDENPYLYIGPAWAYSDSNDEFFAKEIKSLGTKSVCVLKNGVEIELGRLDYNALQKIYFFVHDLMESIFGR